MSAHPRLRPGAVGLLTGALVAGGLALAPSALAAPNGLVINEVYGGGGNAGAPYQNDFIELHNTGGAAVDVSTWSVQYASATGTSWARTNLTGSIPPGGFYLVQEAAGTANPPVALLPTPDATGTTAMSSSAGKVALVSSQTALACGAACAGTAGVNDFVGYGSTANNVEGSGPAPAPSNTTSDARSAGKDTDDNAKDFATAAPGPQNSSTPPADQGTSGSGGGGGTTPPPPAPVSCTDPTTTIGTIQGTTDTSAGNGQTFTVQGTVVGDLQGGGINGVDIQDGGDGNTATSDGIFVFGSKLPALQQGDVLTVRGRVSEYNGLTEIAGTDVVVCSTGAPLPTAAALPIPSDDATREQVESMLVQPTAPLTVSDVYELDYYGELTLASGGRLITPTEAADTGAPAAAVAADNALRSIVLDDGSDVTLGGSPRQPSPYLTVDDPVRVGDTAVLQPEVLRYAHDLWLLEPADGTWQGTTFDATNPRPATPPAVGGNLRIADFNVLNYFPDLQPDFPLARGATTEEQFQRQQTKIVNAIATMDPDIATLHEIENSAVINPSSGEYHAVETLIAALEQKQGVPAGTWSYVKAHEDTDAITNAIIYRTDRGVTAVGGPMIPDAADLAPFSNARTPIAQTFHAGDETFSIIANHLKSKGSSCGAGSDASVTEGGNCNGDRVNQARALVDFAAQVRAQSHDDDVLLSGDFNSYRQEDPVDVITAAGYTDEAPKRAAGEYSYVFDGASGSLDHEFASPSLDGKISGEGIWDINASESFAYEYDGDPNLYAPYPYRSSDHNPSLIGLNTNVPATATVSDPNPLRGDKVTVSGAGFTAGAKVTATLPARNGQVLGTGVAAADGTVQITYRTPVLLPQGSYQVVLTAADGEKATTSFTLRSLLGDLLERIRRVLGGGH